MRLWLRLLITLFVGVGMCVGTWCYLRREGLACQWACYRVGRARTFEDARAKIAWFESGPDYKARLRELARSWASGNQRFDLYLARYVGHPDSSEALRKAFSRGFAWHEERLPRWAYYWSWQTNQEPDREIASILAYLDLVLKADPPKTITWREVLDLQAIFCLAGKPHLAKRLGPENWGERYRRWRKQCRGGLPHVARPSTPFPDWRGPAPQLQATAPQPSLDHFTRIADVRRV